MVCSLQKIIAQSKKNGLRGKRDATLQIGWKSTAVLQLFEFLNILFGWKLTNTNLKKLSWHFLIGNNMPTWRNSPNHYHPIKSDTIFDLWNEPE